MSLCRRCAVPTSPTLRFPSYASLLPRRHARIPLVACRTLFSTPDSSRLVVSGGELKRFPVGRSDFGKIRMHPGLAYFDKTEYIPVLEEGSDVQLVCRPRRFGKSLNVSMLQFFHGFQFRDQYDKLFKVCGCGILLMQASLMLKLGSRCG
jgi:Predicted AAA-ATPase